MIDQQVLREFFAHEAVKQALPALEQAALKGELPAASAARQLFELFRQSNRG